MFSAEEQAEVILERQKAKALSVEAIIEKNYPRISVTSQVEQLGITVDEARERRCPNNFLFKTFKSEEGFGQFQQFNPNLIS